jgi:hypothetical protein
MNELNRFKWYGKIFITSNSFKIQYIEARVIRNRFQFTHRNNKERIIRAATTILLKSEEKSWLKLKTLCTYYRVSCSGAEGFSNSWRENFQRLFWARGSKKWNHASYWPWRLALPAFSRAPVANPPREKSVLYAYCTNTAGNSSLRYWKVPYFLPRAEIVFRK